MSADDVARIDALVDIERSALVATLEQLDDAGWNTPSLCAGWRVRDVVVHLLMAYELTLPRFLAGMVTARFRFDTLADRWARRDPRSPEEVVEALRATASRRFAVPGAPPEAPLSHLVSHLDDVYRPLGVAHRVDPRAARIVLEQLTGPRFRSSLVPGLLDAVALSATDTDWTHGTGAPVVASSSALITTLGGRTAALDELSGEGAPLVRARIRAAGPAKPRAAQ